MTRRDADTDRGAALILAIAMVVMVGAISGGLVALVTSSLNNRSTLELLRDRQYAADAVVEQAITVVRSQLGTPLALCGAPAGVVVETFNTTAIRVDWRNACGIVRSSDGTVVTQRNVIFSACPSTGSACTEAAVVLRAQVNFEQSTGAVTRTYVQSWSLRS